MQSLHDDYSKYDCIDNINMREINMLRTLSGNTSTVISNRLADSSVPTLSLNKILTEGRQKMIEMNIPNMRQHKKEREQRSVTFFKLNIYYTNKYIPDSSQLILLQPI